MQEAPNIIWCNSYCRRKWTQRYEFKSWTKLIAFHIVVIPLGKVWIQLFSFQLWINSRADWTLEHRLGKQSKRRKTQNLNLLAILNESWRQHPTRHQLYSHLPPISKTIQVRRTRRAGHCWRSRDELISDVLLWTPTHGRAKAGRPARAYIQQLCEDTGCCPEDLPEVMNDREKWRERVRDIRATNTT